MDAGPREPVAKAPVFVDVSGRRRRGVTVLGYLGASACTAYLAAFGITLSTTAGTIPAAGVALDPGPVTDEGTEEADTVVAAPVVGSRTVADVAPARPAAKHAASTGRGERAARGRHAAPDPVAAPTRGTGTRLVPLAVTAPAPAVRTPTALTAPAPSAPAPTVPATGTSRPTPDATPTTGGPGGSSSGGAGPTTGTGSGTDTGTDTGTGTTGGTDGTGAGGAVSDPATADVLAIGPVALAVGV
ncbi:MAG TPA: hypothetical protein VNP37_08350 [Actinomycetospora sp.]|nr:hypothetical protein [Actinomycetospora sp.]